MAKATIVQLLSADESFDYKHIMMPDYNLPEEWRDVWCFDRIPHSPYRAAYRAR